MPIRIVLKSRGQTIMLGVLTLLVLAVMMMLTFTVNQVVHEKIRIQSHSDAVAYSTAVVEARAFNSMVYTNRAIAAAVVADMSLHAWMATATSTAAILMGGAMAFGIIAAIEFIEAGFCPYPCCVAIHCAHSIEAIIIAIQYLAKSFEYGNKVQGMESKFNTAVNSYKEMVDNIHSYQKGVLGMALANITTLVPMKLNDINAPRSTVQMQMVAMNTSNFACALEGSDIDGLCQGGASKASESDRSIVIENAANAMRPLYDQLINITDSHEDFRPNSDFLKDIQHNEGNPIVAKFGSAYTGENQSMFSSNTAESKNVGAWLITTFFTQWRDAAGPGAMPAWIFSDKEGGDHFPSWAHSGTHDKFKGIQQEDVCNGDNCFINFRADSDEKHDFGQPSAYGSVKYETLHERQTGGGRANNAWLVNDKGTIELQTGGSGTAKVNLIPRKPGIAISKAKAYFHQIGNWQAPPNFFDPFWRAKLHPFSREEAITQAGIALDMDGAANAATMPIEGDDR